MDNCYQGYEVIIWAGFLLFAGGIGLGVLCTGIASIIEAVDNWKHAWTDDDK